MKALRWISMGALALTLALGSCSTGSEVTEPGYYDVPDWAPYYDPSIGARYYYFPDMLTYYDVYSGQFVYWNGFNWSYVTSPPYGYSPYDLANTYIIVLDHNVHDPWLHHNYYSTVYPKGYYYGPRNISHPRGMYPYRGYNENSKAPILPGEQPTVDPGTPVKPRSTPNINTTPNTTAPVIKPNTPRPGTNVPRQAPAPVQPAPQQPRINPAPQQPRMNNPAPQPRMNPAPQQRTMPSQPKVGERRPGAK